MSLRINYPTPANCTLISGEWTQNIANHEVCDGNIVSLTCVANGWQTTWGGNATRSPELRRKALIEIADTLYQSAVGGAGPCTFFSVSKAEENWGVTARKVPTSGAGKWSKVGAFGFALALVAAVASLSAS
ncbi:hypothetical protein HDU96_005558, partial [Phlyctochytrium bullatum]